jgi:uncharacterized protein
LRTSPISDTLQIQKYLSLFWARKQGEQMILLESIRQPIAQLCNELNVARLDIFGSAVTERFPKTSDIVVAFGDHKRRFDRYFLLKERMEELLGRPVDLVVDDAIRNPYFREAVEESRVNVYTVRYEEASV